MIVGEIMTRDSFHVEEDSFLTRARQIIRDNHLRGLPVINKGGHVIGIITSQDALRVSSTRSNVTVAGFAIKVPLITEDMGVLETAKLMFSEKCDLLPVVQSEVIPVLKGTVSLVDIFKNIDLKSVPKKAVSEIMSKEIATCNPKDPVTKVWNRMLESDFTGIPVLSDDGMPLGMITRFDILKKGGARTSKEVGARSQEPMRVEKLMSTPIYHVGPDDDLHHAIKLMLKHDLGRVSVVDQGKLVGIVDRYDLIKISYIGE